MWEIVPHTYFDFMLVTNVEYNRSWTLISRKQCSNTMPLFSWDDGDRGTC